MAAQYKNGLEADTFRERDDLEAPLLTGRIKNMLRSLGILGKEKGEKKNRGCWAAFCAKLCGPK